MLLFRASADKFPPIKCVGDVVRLHRVKTTEYNSMPQGLCGGGFASLVFDGDPALPIEPRAGPAGNDDYTWTERALLHHALLPAFARPSYAFPHMRCCPRRVFLRDLSPWHPTVH